MFLHCHLWFSLYKQPCPLFKPSQLLNSPHPIRSAQSGSNLHFQCLHSSIYSVNLSWLLVCDERWWLSIGYKNNCLKKKSYNDNTLFGQQFCNLEFVRRTVAILFFLWEYCCHTVNEKQRGRSLWNIHQAAWRRTRNFSNPEAPSAENTVDDTVSRVNVFARIILEQNTCWESLRI